MSIFIVLGQNERAQTHMPGNNIEYFETMF